MDSSYIKLALAALFPVVASVILYLVNKKTPFKKLPYAVKQIIFGVIFGGIAVFGTEFGIPMNGAQVNCRDASVLIGGLMFGAPAGIIAGVIGGVERWIAVAWGVGTATRVACSVSTAVAGLYAALLRKYMFENKKPGILISFAVGMVMEVFHMNMVFMTNVDDYVKAMAIVKACTIPMVLGNSLSVMLSALAMALLRRTNPLRNKQHGTRISQTIQRWMLLAVILAFAATSVFIFAFQDGMATSQSDTQLSTGLEDTVSDIEDASNSNLLSLTELVAVEANTKSLEEISTQYKIAEISKIDSTGVIFDSTNPDFVGFDMSSGEQSMEFMCLLKSTKRYVQKYGPITYDPNIWRKYAGVKTDYGFVQVGYDADNFQRDIDSLVQGITANRHVGKTGYVVVMNKNYDVASMPEHVDLFVQSVKDIGLTLSKNEAEETFSLNIEGTACYAQYTTAEGYYIVSVMPVEEAVQARDIALYLNTFMEILVFAILFGLIYLLIKKVVVNQIDSVNQSLAIITGGNLDEVVNVRSNAEFASLSDDINSTVDTLKRYIAEASARIDKELEFAKNIQSSALPTVFPKRDDFNIFASMDPAKEVGGDFYDFYVTHDTMLHFLIADVSGKGIPAAMFMMRAKTELKSLTEADMNISDVFTHGNGALCEGNDAGMFVTAWQGNLDLKTGLVQFVSAGHNPPLVRHGNGQFEYLKARAGFVLAGMEGVRYKAQELQLQPGDMVFLYTDGVTEATDANNQLYGEDRLLAAINSQEFPTVKDLCKYIRKDVDAFVGEAPQFDDITMVALKYTGAAQESEQAAE